MIRVEERNTARLPGITSLFVSFDYDKAIVDELRLMQNCTYDEKTKEWEIPLTSLSEFLDRCCKITSINLTLSSKDQSDCRQPQLCHQYITEPFDHQLEGISFGMTHDSWLLLDAPGLGKTLQITYLAQELKQQRGIEHCLIICGINTLKTNWKNEIEKHSNLSCRILGQRYTRKGKLVVDGIAERLKQLQQPIDEFFVVVNVESLRDDRIVKGILTGPNKFDMIVLDEAHKCFEYNTLIQTDKGLLKIGDIVTQDIDCCVYSYNHRRQIYEYRPLISKFKQTAVQLLKLTFEEDGVIHTLQCTPDHLIFTKNRGYVPASELTCEDEFLLANIV